MKECTIIADTAYASIEDCYDESPSRISIEIGEEVHPLEGDFSSWISSRAHQRLSAGLSCDVSVKIGAADDLRLTCYGSEQNWRKMPRRKFTSAQRKIVDLWVGHGLHDWPYDPGRLISFLDQLEEVVDS